jgi:hypothetical protein
MGCSRTERIDLRQTGRRILHAAPRPALMTSLPLKLVMTSLPSPPMMTLARLLPMIRWAVSLPVRLIHAVSAEEIAAGRPG